MLAFAPGVALGESGASVAAPFPLAADGGACDTVLDPLLKPRAAAAWTTRLACAEALFREVARACVADGVPVGVADVDAAFLGSEGWRQADAIARRSDLLEGSAVADRLDALGSYRAVEAAGGRRTPDDDAATVAHDTAVVVRARLDDPVEVPEDGVATAPNAVAASACGGERLAAATSLYAQLYRDLHEIEEVVPSDALCRVYAHGAATRVWSGAPGADELLRDAAAAHGGACAGVMVPLLADTRIARMHVEAERASPLPAYIAVPADGATWRLDGVVTGSDGAPTRTRAGLHRVERATVDGYVLVAMIPLAEGEASEVTVVDGQLVLSHEGAAWSATIGGGDPAQSSGTRVAVVTGAAFEHANYFGILGVSVAHSARTIPLGVTVRGMYMPAAWQMYYSRGNTAYGLLRADVLLDARWERPSLTLRGGLGLTGEVAIALGGYAEIGLEVPVGPVWVDASIGAPWHFLRGETDPGYGISTILAVGPRLKRRPSATP